MTPHSAGGRSSASLDESQPAGGGGRRGRRHDAGRTHGGCGSAPTASRRDRLGSRDAGGEWARRGADTSAGRAGEQGDHLHRPRESADDRGRVGRGGVGFVRKQSAHADLTEAIRAVLAGGRFVSHALRDGGEISKPEDATRDFHEGGEP